MHNYSSLVVLRSRSGSTPLSAAPVGCRCFLPANENFVKDKGRLSAIDALRGVAALAVVFFHVPPELRELAHLPRSIAWLLEHGALGVDAFFVLSGFVVALSVKQGPWTLGYFGRFALRRSIRLDPPYWVAILLEVSLGWLGMRFLSAKDYPMPTIGDLAAHITYTQELFRRLQISDVFWTLCYEIQFYVTLVALLVVATSKPVRSFVRPQFTLGFALVFLIVWSLAVRSGIAPNPMEGIALIRAYEFGAGIVVMLGAYGFISKTVLTIGLFAIAGPRVMAGGIADAVVVLLASLVCYHSAKSLAFNNATVGRIPQYFGRISYSLYLYHASIVGRFSTVAIAMIGVGGASYMYGIAIFASVVASVIVAGVFYQLFEAPALRLSRRISLRGPSDVPSVVS